MPVRSQYDNVVIDQQGNALENIQVSVFDAGTSNATTLYAGRLGGTTIPNPFTTEEFGLIQFWCEPGLYDIDWHDLNTVPRISDRFITWSAISGAPSGVDQSQIDFSASGLLPTGVVTPYVGDTAPTGWLLCNGNEVSRVTYSALYTVIGIKYGSGDGSTTFNLPDARGRSMYGAGTHSDVNTLGDNDGITPANRTPQHLHADGTLAADTHTHGAGSFAVNTHSHTVASHSHTSGSLSGNAHDHTVGAHYHGSGSLTVNSHSHTVNSHEHQVSSHVHGAGSLYTGGASSTTMGGLGWSANGFGTHNHDDLYGNTGSSAPWTDSRSPGTSSVAPGVNGNTANSGAFNTGSNSVGISGNTGAANPSTDSVAPGVNGASGSSGTGVTGNTATNTTPYLVTNMIIKT